MFKRHQRSNEDIAFDILFAVLGFLALIICFYPMYFVVIASPGHYAGGLQAGV